MADASSPALPRRVVDERGQVFPMTEAQVRARAAEIAYGLAALDDLGDEDEQRQTLEALIEGIDQDRESYRRRFR